MRLLDERTQDHQELSPSVAKPSAPALQLPFGSVFDGEICFFIRAMERLRQLDGALADCVERKLFYPDAEVDPKLWQRAYRWLMRYVREEARRAGFELH